MTSQTRQYRCQQTLNHANVCFTITVSDLQLIPLSVTTCIKFKAWLCHSALPLEHHPFNLLTKGLFLRLHLLRPQMTYLMNPFLYSYLLELIQLPPAFQKFIIHSNSFYPWLIISAAKFRVIKKKWVLTANHVMFTWWPSWGWTSLVYSRTLLFLCGFIACQEY